jgi:DNA repair protein RadC
METLARWPADDRPREKLLKRGPNALTDSELLAIFLRTGVQGKNVVELARDMLAHFGGLKNLFAADYASFTAFKGLGQAKFVQLQACLEMSQRYLAEQLTTGDAINNPSEVKSYIQSRLVGRKNEVFAVLFLNNQHQILSFEELFFGTVNASSVHPRVIVQRALAINAAAIIVSHNHPSGVAEASHSDIDITRSLKAAMNLIDVRLLDHLIIAGHQVTSMAEQGLV